MAIENTTSIPGILPSLLAEVKQLLAENKQEFLDYLDKYVGTILRQLDISEGNPVIENSHSNWHYCFKVAHTTVKLSMSGSFYANHEIGVRVEGSYFGNPETNWIRKEKLSYYLLTLIGSIVEEYQQYRFLAADLKSYNACLRIAARKTENDIASDKLSLWSWPDRVILNLHKITWTKGGYYDSDTGEAYLQYESAWSLSDRPDEKGYFDLLTRANSVDPRKLKVTPNSVELFPVASIKDVPADLMTDIYRQYDVAIASEVSIQQLKGNEEQVLDYKRELEELEGEDYIHMVFPEYLPEYPASDNSHLVAYKTESILLGRSPCLGIRLAVEAITQARQ